MKNLNISFKTSQFLDQGLALIGQMMFLQHPNAQMVQNSLKMTYLLEEKYFGRLYNQSFDNSEVFYHNKTESSREKIVFKIDLIKAINKMRFVLNVTGPISLGNYFNSTPVKDLFDVWTAANTNDVIIEPDFSSITYSYYYLGGFFLGVLLSLFVLRLTYAK